VQYILRLLNNLSIRFLSLAHASFESMHGNFYISASPNPDRTVHTGSAGKIKEDPAAKKEL
jgi:hypothetical protein